MKSFACLLLGLIVGTSIHLLHANTVCSRECTPSCTVCRFVFSIDPCLTMMHGDERVVPRNGSLYYYDDITYYNATTGLPLNDTTAWRINDTVARRIITTDGEQARFVISIHDQMADSALKEHFPGPPIVVYEGQVVEVFFTNRLHADTVSVHFHGIHQKNTPWMDGVPFVTQCPILPGVTFKYKFKANPAGTHYYHSQIAGQTGLGLYGPLIVKSRKEVDMPEHIMLLQDWNHDLDPETVYLKSVTSAYSCTSTTNCSKYEQTRSSDNTKFGNFEFHSGLINGRGRYYDPITGRHNGAPLTRFVVKEGDTYRFRVINAATIYAFRVYIPGHSLTIITTDGQDLQRIEVDSFVIQPGERIDFLLYASNPFNVTEYMITADTLEVNLPVRHIAEAILQYDDENVNRSLSIPDHPCNPRGNFTCRVFNCPFKYFSRMPNLTCITLNDVNGYAIDPNRDEIITERYPKRLFLNFAFPGRDSNPGSVNGIRFLRPKVSALTQRTQVEIECNDPCSVDQTPCYCMHTVYINEGDIVEMILLNKGSGKGGSQPVHLHGHSFYVAHQGFPEYQDYSGEVLNDNQDVECVDVYCNRARWRPGQNWQASEVNPRIPPLKDTVVVPSGGYVVLRFKADNLGLWYLQSMVDIYNTNGLAVLLDESTSKLPAKPYGYPVCGDYTAFQLPLDNERRGLSGGLIALIVISLLLMVALIVLLLVFYHRRKVRVFRTKMFKWCK
ncbi:L-ascorbate oxidase-like [Haliotis rubra]|uniref:L-ascorbate oxidase-like n=1 Tax=Haliotis rubra TaxID=36100 RepID=UPI001EE5F2D0|nr:L-ascorbate oxidase-like [Haliotis rubra]XP_046570584.1 L-ascorbate oxidase-like [Haliotis rubra]XP_046570592.1 L-ascorbate oxidase-like [Haliotis rubra]